MLPESIRRELLAWDEQGMSDDVIVLQSVIKALRREYEETQALIDEIGFKGLHTPSECPAGVGDVPS
jgi:hypothetical protein